MISHGLEHRDIESRGRSLSFKIKGPCSGMEERILNWREGGLTSERHRRLLVGGLEIFVKLLFQVFFA